MSKSKYSKAQIKKIQRLKARGLSNLQIHEKYNDTKGWNNISIHALRHLVRKHALPKGAPKATKDKTYIEVSKARTKKKYIKSFVGLVRREGFVPTFAAFAGFLKTSTSTIKKSVGSFEELEAEALKLDPKMLEGVIDETSFTVESFSELQKEVSQHKKFFITSAVTGCKPHSRALKAVKNFCEVENAKLLIMPLSDPANQKPRKYKFSLHPDLPQDGIVFQDLRINSNLYLSVIKLQAKQIQPLTGLRGLGQKSSCILASPKQSLEAVSSSNLKAIPNHLTTTGVITEAEYETKNYVSERTAYLAKSAHVLGGIVVEVKNDRVFFYRHVQFDPKTGAFFDLDKRYHANGKVETVRAELVQMPDWHTGHTCPTFRKVAKEIVSVMKPRWLTLEDFFDGSSISPFERKNVIARAKRLSGSTRGFQTLSDELKACSKELSELNTWDVEKIVIKRGNHDDFLHRWLQNADYSTDGLNHYLGVVLAKAMLEGEMPIEFALREIFPFNKQKKVRFLELDESFKVGGIEQAAHGHLGAGGKRNPGLKGLECYGEKSNSGHTHAPGILGGVWRAGTATTLFVGYNHGASAWSNTLLIQYYGGYRQLVTMIEGGWRA